MKVNPIILVVGSVVFSAAATYPLQSHAYYERHTYMECIQNRWESVAESNQIWFSHGGNANRDKELHLVCPIPDTSTVPKSTFASVDIYFEDNNDIQAAKTMLCANHRSSDGGTCLGSKNTTGSGYQYVIQTVGTLWDTSTDYPYLLVTLPIYDGEGQVNGMTYLKSYVLKD